jgi:hypothetical protein
MAAAFRIGTRVILQGLKTRPDYNGHTGVVVHPTNPHTGRCLVKLRDGEECSLRPENLREDPDQVQSSLVSRCHIGCRVVLHGLVAQPHYNSRVGLVTKPVQSDNGRCLVKLCNGGEEVTIRSQNLTDASDAIWSSVATSADAQMEVLLKAVSFLSKFNSLERRELIAKMQIKDKFEFMREGAWMHAYFQECLQGATGTEVQTEQPCVAALNQVVCAQSDVCSYSLPKSALDDSGADPPAHQIPTFPFRWSKGQTHCVENEDFDPSGIDEPSDVISDVELLENDIFGSHPPTIYPVRSHRTSLTCAHLHFFVTLCPCRFSDRVREVGIMF